MRTFFFFLFLFVPAWADTSVTARDDGQKCTMQDSPYYRRMMKGDRSRDRERTQRVMGESGELRGILALEPKRLELWSPPANRRWSVPRSESGDSAATLVAGKLLIISVFHRIATGASLFAVDLETGQERWRAEVLQLNVAHSKYFNDVTLERRGDTVVMRGYEAGGCYRQTFELESGKRLSAHMP